MHLPKVKMIKRHHQMSCPDCTIPMRPFSCSNVVVDRCENCKGIWFDYKELGIFKDKMKELPIEKVEVDYSETSNVQIISTCTRCQEMLHDMNYAYNSQVIIKKCPRCKGIWLPNGELLKFVNLVKTGKILEPEINAAAKELIKFTKETVLQKRFNDEMEEERKYRRWGGIEDHVPVILPHYDANQRKKNHWVTTGITIFLGIVIFVDHKRTFLNRMFDFSFIPFMANVIFLWTFGYSIEDALGKIKYIIYFLICLFFSHWSFGLINQNHATPIEVLEGGISGLMAAYIYLYPKINIKTLVSTVIFDIPSWVYMCLWLISQMLVPVLSFEPLYFNRVFGAHIGGFFSGLILSWLLYKLGLVSTEEST